MGGIPLFIPVVVTAVTLVVGFGGSRGQLYWIRGAIAILIAFAMAFLGSGAGTLDDPTGDGLVTRWIRQASDDGAAVAIWGIAMLAIGYGSIIYLLVTGVRRDRAIQNATDRAV